MLIEDVACPVDKLGDMTQDLVDMFQKYEYKDASCFGHALEGNLHLVFSQVSWHPSAPTPFHLVLYMSTQCTCPATQTCCCCFCQAAYLSSHQVM